MQPIDWSYRRVVRRTREWSWCQPLVHPHAGALRDEVLLTGSDGNALVINNQGVAALHDDHVFVEVMHMWRGQGRFAAGPECHLAPVHSVKDVTFYSGSRLTARCDPVGRTLHELREIVHRFSFYCA